MAVLYCDSCKTVVLLKEWTVAPCTTCGSRVFSNVPPNYGKDKRPYDLTVSDRRFLRSIRVEAGEDWYDKPKETTGT